MNYLASGKAPELLGNDGQFRKFCILAGCAELVEDTRIATNSAGWRIVKC